MPTWVYSHESFPSDTLIGRPGYTPVSPMYAGITLTLKGKEWQKLPDYYPMLHHRDWMDKRGTASRIYSDEVVKGLKNFNERGVIFLDHEPTAAEKEELPKLAETLNLEFRARCIKDFEEQIREKELTGHGRTRPTPYEDECYTILGMHKPYSPEALKSARQPGIEAAERIADAIVGALKRDRDDLLSTKVPKPVANTK